ncbi:ABC transporter permease [Methylopila jiangsuensis]|uniref:ABC transporter permease n=1 Tax=Methylopila jiangsuensis TaxID=586230 RepID=A0A9W6N2J4_9HYPH|nr:ABC transporter permease subunit [Methylopila jiangsuensis]MDR6285540.1 glycine betaine/proline transport system permease protein [Methylopila jiangsuensis]GLK75298.1 ABC transporter permease [Methylopila jiangsuensis]
MSVADARPAAPAAMPKLAPGKLLWPLVALVTVALVMAPAGALPAWAVKLPAAWQLGLAPQISAFMKWLMESATFGLFSVREFTRAIAWTLDLPLSAAKAVLSTGLVIGQGSDAVKLAPPIPWFAMVALGIAAGYAVSGVRLAVLMGLGLLYLAVFGQWAGAMVTLASVLVSSLLGAFGGLLLGLACVRWRAVERAVGPLLDLAQTMPVFAYLLPMLILFGFGPVSAMVATIIYAMPPMVRVTILAIRAVPEDVRSLAVMTGCTRRQTTWKMLVPTALPALMVGVNQVIMLSLNVVIIASMIGAGGLGFDVLTALRRNDIGAGLEAGLAITVLAILLDRFAQGLAHGAERGAAGRSGRRLALWAALAGVAALWLAAALWPSLATYPEAWRLSTAPWWNELVRWINLTFYSQLEAVKVFFLLNILVPVKRFMLALPWPWVAAVVTLAGFRLGGLRLAAVTGLMTLFIALSGLWPAAMVTVYLCGVGVALAMLIGVPIGLLAAANPTARKITDVAVDTLQTLPSFVYLIPFVMLFKVGDFTALIAIVLYAVAPAIRYTAHGVSQIHPALIEAGVMNGCTRLQSLLRIRLPLATPEILLGLNQTLMLALSMLVITALVGTRDLGQEVYSALAQANVGKGLVAGLCVAFIGIIADRLLSAASGRLRQRLGLG